METTPFRHFLAPKPCSSPGWGPGSAQATSLQSTDTEILSTYNAAMDKIASNITCTRLPLTSQLDSWDECTAAQRQYYIHKAAENFMLVCDVIALNDGKRRFHALVSPGEENNDTVVADDVLKALMTAYKIAEAKSTKTQILSLYSCKYSISTLKKLHSPYDKLSTRQIQRARCHAKTIGPGRVPEKKKDHRVRIDMSKVDHFIEFINRPYFYQDVS